MRKQTGKGEHILCVVGARPNFMKIAPVMRAFEAQYPPVRACLLHTGQHYDVAMKHAFFEQLQIPEPDIDLGVGSGSHAQQTADIMKAFEPVLLANPPSAVLVVGDVNSTIACSLVAVKLGIPIMHVEAGLRSGDRTMPEEINRILTDQLSDLLFTTERTAASNLAREGVNGDVHFVGNVMIDTLRFNLDMAVPSQHVLRRTGAEASVRDGHYGLLTLHRPSNVDDREILERLLLALRQASKRLPLLFPVHPRTEQRLRDFGFAPLLSESGIVMLPPQGYLEMLGLMRDATVVFTDSGGVQEETTALGVPCITLRESTERPITVSEGTNTIVGSDAGCILNCFEETLGGRGKAGRIPELWDGKSAGRIAATVRQWLGGAADDYRIA